MQRCIDECESCRSACLTAVTYCLDRGGRYADALLVRMLIDCADMCTTCADFLLRDSMAHRRVCEVCAEICDLCAELCATLPDDEMLGDCAADCLSCAGACRDMVRSSAGM